MSKRNPFKHDSYGTRIKAHRLANKPACIYKRRGIATLATLLFVIADLMFLYTMWRDTMAATNFMLVILTSLTMGVLLDVPMAIAAYCVREYEQKLVKKRSVKIVLSLSILTFLSVFIPNIAFRFSTIEKIMMEDLDKSVLFVAAMFLSISTLSTTLGSFVITYFSSNPLADMIFFKEEARIRSETNIEEAHECLSQVGSHLEYMDAVLAREEEAYKNAINAADLEAANAKQIARLVIAQKLNNPDDINVAIKSGKEVNSSTESSELSNDAILNFVEEYTTLSTTSHPDTPDQELDSD